MWETLGNVANYAGDFLGFDGNFGVDQKAFGTGSWGDNLGLGGLASSFGLNDSWTNGYAVPGTSNSSSALTSLRTSPRVDGAIDTTSTANTLGSGLPTTTTTTDEQNSYANMLKFMRENGYMPQQAQPKGLADVAVAVLPAAVSGGLNYVGQNNANDILKTQIANEQAAIAKEEEKEKLANSYMTGATKSAFTI